MKQLIRIILLLLIILLAGAIWPTISGPMSAFISILVNVFIAAGLAYISYPVQRFFEKLGMNFIVATLVTMLIFIAIIATLVFLSIMITWPQIIKAIQVFQNASADAGWLSKEPTIRKIYDYLTPYFEQMSKTLLNYIGVWTQEAINKSAQFIGAAALVVAVYIYMIFDAKNIVANIKKRLNPGSRKYSFFQKLDKEYLHYLKSLALLTLITSILYGTVYYFIGHPDWFVLAVLCAFGNLIPYFGGIIVNIIALITAIFVSPQLLLAVGICVIVLPVFEGNILYPYIYKKTIKLNPILLLPALFLFGGLFGVLGLILTIPIVIFYEVAKKYYKDDFKKLLHRIWTS